MLDLVLSNRTSGGVPVARLIEVAGGEGAGKTLLASYMMADTQRQGGVAIFIDSEHAASMEVLEATGVDTNKLVYIQADTVEDVFTSMESITNQIAESKTNKLITIVWDSVAASPPKAEVEGNYGDQTIALKARLISAGLRKYIPICSSHNVCLVFINQLRSKIGGVAFGDQSTTPGGKAIPYHASVRLRVSHFKQIKDSDGNIVGRIIKCEIKKNKVAPPMRTVYYTIRWGDKPGAWIDEVESLWDAAIRAGVLEKKTAQKYVFEVPSTKEKMELTKNKFTELLNEAAFSTEFKNALAEAYIITGKKITETILEDVENEDGL